MVEPPGQHLLAEGDDVWGVLQLKPLVTPHPSKLTVRAVLMGCFTYFPVGPPPVWTSSMR